MMASWVTHLMIADQVMKYFNALDRRGFCVGNIAPDCNVENEDWSFFTPAREVTHWMKTDTKDLSCADDFLSEYVTARSLRVESSEHYSFLLGYYAHLITDAMFQTWIRDFKRVQDAWQRIKADNDLSKKSIWLFSRLGGN